MASEYARNHSQQSSIAVQPTPIRRALLLSGVCAACSLGLQIPSWAQQAPTMAKSFWQMPRTLTLKHSAGERLKITYWRDQQLIDSAHQEISWFMRDRFANKAILMHPALLDIIFGVCGWLDYFGIRESIVLNSAYRDPVRNLQIEGASKDSYHTKGAALDIHIQGVSDLQLAKFGAWLGAGGVGWYPSKKFTHLDLGSRRTWTGL